MSRISRLWYKVRMGISDWATHVEYARAKDPFPDDVANTPHTPWEEDYIRGPAPFGGMEERSDTGSPVYNRRISLGRRTSDYGPANLITRKLVVLTVLIINVLCFAGDALFVGAQSCH